MRIEKTITLGGIINLIVIVTSAISLYIGIVTRITNLEVKVDTMWSVFINHLNRSEVPLASDH